MPSIFFYRNVSILLEFLDEFDILNHGLSKKISVTYCMKIKGMLK